jgi:hypothetical protein
MSYSRLARRAPAEWGSYRVAVPHVRWQRVAIVTLFVVGVVAVALLWLAGMASIMSQP